MSRSKPISTEYRPQELSAYRHVRNVSLLCIFALISWAHDLRSEIQSPKGWKLLAQIIAGAVLLWGALLGVMTYQSANLVELRDTAEKSQHELVHDLEAPSVRIRIDAIHRIPAVLLRQVPESDSVTALEAIRLTFGGHRQMVSPYKHSMQRLIRSHLANLNGANEDWSLDEVVALINLLGRLGPEGWYNARSGQPSASRVHGLSWLWSSELHPDQIDPSTLFENVKMAGVNLQQFYLEYADFKGALLNHANLSFTHLAHSNLRGADLSGADLSTTDARYSVFEDSKAIGAYFTSSIIDFTNFKLARLDGAHFQESHCTQCIFQNASMNRLSAVSADFSRSDLSFSSLRNAAFQGANLDSADLSYAAASSANFANANLAHAQFANADLRHADFSKCTGLSDAAGWQDANIAGVIGLSAPVRALLLAKGAVEIIGDNDWLAYKEAGRPHRLWRFYSHRPIRKGTFRHE